MNLIEPISVYQSESPPVRRRLIFEDEPLTPVLRRSYKAMCPLMCKLGLTISYEVNNNIVYHPECKKNLLAIQKVWRKKIKINRLKNVTHVLNKKLNNINITDFIEIVFKFL